MPRKINELEISALNDTEIADTYFPISNIAPFGDALIRIKFSDLKTKFSTSATFTSTVATGTAPLVVASTTVVINLNADRLDGQHGSYYQDSSNQNAGTLPDARMPALTGDITSQAGAVSTTLATVNTDVGTYGTNAAVPRITVDGKGRVTGVSTQALGSAALADTGVTGHTVPYLDAANTWNGFQKYNAGVTLESGNLVGDGKWTGYLMRSLLLRGFVLDTHPESFNKVVDPFFSNDIAFLHERGGSTTTNHPDLPNGNPVFYNGAPDYVIFNTTNIPAGGMIITLTLHQTMYYTNAFGISFGLEPWAAKDFKVETYSDATATWVTANIETNVITNLYQIPISRDGDGINRVRVTLDNWVGSSGRIAQIYLVNYNGKGGKNIFLARDGEGGMVNTNVVTNLNADLLDGQQGSFYQNADNLNTGTLPAARLATVNSNTGTFGSSSQIPVVTVNDKGLVTAVSTASFDAGGVSALDIAFFKGYF